MEESANGKHQRLRCHNGWVFASTLRLLWYARGGTLAAAQAVYPAATSLTNEIDWAAFTQAIQTADTTGGKGGVVYVPQGAVMLGSMTVVFRSNVRVMGAGRRATRIHYSGSGLMIDARNCTLSGLSAARLHLGSSTTAVGISVDASSSSVMYNEFLDLEIIGQGDTSVSGQIGVRGIADPEVISSNWFTNINIQEVARPIVWTGPEGNFWIGFTIDRFGVGANAIAIEATSHADRWIGRIAGHGPGVSGHVGYQQGGSRSIADIVSDHGGSALNVTGSDNIVILQRPEGVDSVGSFSASTSVIDGAHGTLRRIRAGGTALSAGDFILSGFGSTATVTNISGTDQRFRFLVNALGSGLTANPTINLTFHDGAWPSAPFALVARTAGNQIAVQNIWVCGSTSTLTITFLGMPVAGETYEYIGIVMG